MMLLNKVWGYETEVETNAVMCISATYEIKLTYLEKKSYIQTVRELATLCVREN